MTREEFIAANPIERVLEKYGIPVIGNGPRKMAKCPFHEDKQASMSVDTIKGLWNCFAGCGGGSVIDLFARLLRISPVQVLKDASKDRTLPEWRPPAATAKPSSNGSSGEKAVIETVYSYRDFFGEEIYQAVRMKPKSFRQRRPDGSGGWIWNMDGIERVLYRLPEVSKTDTVAIAEGEKDAETLVKLGFCGTTNVGGAKNWLPAYADMLTAKELLIFYDNDKAGEEWRDEVLEACNKKCRSVLVVVLPKTSKDITDFVTTFPDIGEARKAIDDLIASTHPIVNGERLPIYTVADVEARYARHASRSETESLNLGKWLPSLGYIGSNRAVRNLVPGEVCLIVANTGVGKTALLSNIAIKADPLPTLIFEMELPGELLFERLAGARLKMDCAEIEENYAKGASIGQEALRAAFPHIYLCWESRLNMMELEQLIIRSQLKIGRPPRLVLIDYVQLVQGKGSGRYERMSNIAEELKIVAKATRTIIVVASQVHRPNDDNPEVTLHDAKDSGSLENSSGLVLGAWRDPDDTKIMHIRVLKNTKGQAGFKVRCNFVGEQMLITEASPTREDLEAASYEPDLPEMPAPQQRFPDP